MAIRVGTANDDLLLGLGSTDYPDGVAGNDRVAGRGGNDVLHGDGNGGQDALLIDGHRVTLDLNAEPPPHILGIDLLDLTGDADNARRRAGARRAKPCESYPRRRESADGSRYQPDHQLMAA